VYQVKSFTEKPSRELANQFVKSGEYLWNSGIFIWNIKAIVKAFQTFLPTIHEAFEEAQHNPDFDPYKVCPDVSIDVGIMEKASNVFVIPANFGWSDIGTWVSLYELRAPSHDYFGNAVSSKNVMTYDAHNNLINTPKDKLVVIQGLDNYIVVDTDDALLICKSSQEQKIKHFTQELKKRIGGEVFL
jgi:mannose-1-phosphate guanylyltransferase